MSKGKKNCPKCGIEQGARATKCACGHQFKEISHVVASAEPMIREAVSGAASVIQRVEDRNAGFVPYNIPEKKWQDYEDDQQSQLVSENRVKPEIRTPEVKPEITEKDRRFKEERAERAFGSGSFTSTPAGRTQIRPEGYKEGWPDGPASDEVITKWADAVFSSGNFGASAVLYFARQYWDINSAEYQRIRTMILSRFSRA